VTSVFVLMGIIWSLGMLVGCWQLFDTLGILLGSVANLATFLSDRKTPDWRLMIALPFVPAIMFLTLIPFCVGKPLHLKLFDSSKV
jgi:MFS family permease